MKLHSIPILRIIFLFAVLTCTGITVYTYSQDMDFNLELSAGSNNVENRCSSEVNASDDDQIHHSNEVFSNADLSLPIPITQDYSLIPKFVCSIWQPPKIS